MVWKYSKGLVNMSEKRIYRLNDDISFRKCSLYDDLELHFGDCTNFSSKEVNWNDYFECNQMGLYFHCTKHPEIELAFQKDELGEVYLSCPQCKNKIEEIESIQQLRSECLRMLNIPEFKGAKLIRLDDWYVPEVKIKHHLITLFHLKSKPIKMVTQYYCFIYW